MWGRGTRAARHVGRSRAHWSRDGCPGGPPDGPGRAGGGGAGNGIWGPPACEPQAARDMWRAGQSASHTRVPGSCAWREGRRRARAGTRAVSDFAQDTPGVPHTQGARDRRGWTPAPPPCPRLVCANRGARHHQRPTSGCWLFLPSTGHRPQTAGACFCAPSLRRGASGPPAHPRTRGPAGASLTAQAHLLRPPARL